MLKSLRRSLRDEPYLKYPYEPSDVEVLLVCITNLSNIAIVLCAFKTPGLGLFVKEAITYHGDRRKPI